MLTPNFDRAQQAIAEVLKNETKEPITAAELENLLKENVELRIDIENQKKLYPNSTISVHKYNRKIYVIGHVITKEGTIKIPYWNTDLPS